MILLERQSEPQLSHQLAFRFHWQTFLTDLYHKPRWVQSIERFLQIDGSCWNKPSFRTRFQNFEAFLWGDPSLIFWVSKCSDKTTRAYITTKFSFNEVKCVNYLVKCSVFVVFYYSFHFIFISVCRIYKRRFFNDDQIISLM